MTTRNIALAAIFISLSAIGGMLKIPVGIASVALDAMPALIAALFLSAPLTGTVAALGHLASALYGGFPLGPMHALIAIEMGLVLWLFAKLHKSGRQVLKWIAFVFGNGVVAALPFYFLLSPAFFYTSVPGLLIASAMNALGAAAAMPFMASRLRERVK
ncbi:ECF transporter S component [Planomicrobium sp. CPCC 101079]|uniref:ECF transporter S component n=1 Tax=Planomicrobium sp. CPCC 101079 TaxID=2599618 RepID=UPI0011B7AA3A|nr:ECF transporter S component [Planomicrobium sp. CPCC 101079]TWT03498.1 ECF transporter S component [Planomicrobium sp. CPCC 101079]